jgi:hypothetical protein
MRRFMLKEYNFFMEKGVKRGGKGEGVGCLG